MWIFGVWALCVAVFLYIWFMVFLPLPISTDSRLDHLERWYCQQPGHEEHFCQQNGGD